MNTVPSPWGEGLVGLAPQTILQAPQLKYETLYIGGVFVKFWNVKPPCTNVKPLLKTFWRRFWMNNKNIV